MPFYRPHKDRPNTRPTRNMTNEKLLAAVVLALTPLVPTVAAAQAGGACPIDVIPHPGGGSPAFQADGSPPPIELEADQIELPSTDLVVLIGNAQVSQGAKSIYGERLQYDKASDQIEVEGDVTIHTPRGDRVDASFANVQLETQIGEARDGRFWLADKRRKATGPEQAIVSGRGEAERVFFEGEGRIRAENATYTQCPIGKDDVVLSVSELTLDKDTGVGKAKGMKVKFKGVPIFYWPQASFPITDERKSGFLFPSFGGGNTLGAAIDLPYYFNISPHRDATLVPRYYGERGFQLGGEFRYLNERSQGILRGEFLPDDDDYGDDRWGYSFDHDQRFGDGWRAEVEVQEVSDERYLDDFSNNLDVSSATHLPQRAEVRYSGEIVQFGAQVLSHTTLDSNITSANRPYDQLPEFNLDAKWRDVGAFDLGFDSSLVNFDRDDRVHGWRGRVKPYVQLPLEERYGYLRPKLSAQFIGYDLTDQTPGASDSPSAFVPMFSVDGKIFFERLGKNNTTQSLEPRLFYVFIPEENQDDFPNFDTGEVNADNFGNLFREQRFFGGDRVGDTNQLTAGLTWRLLDSEGDERLQASIAQLYWFEDRKVNLRPGEVDTENDSDIFAELRGDVTDSWNLNSALQWNTNDSQTQEFRFDIEYEPNVSRFFALGYRFRRNSEQQVNARLRWPLGPRWSLSVTERYSIDEEQNLETTVGLTYDSCCWALHFGAQSRQDQDEDQREVVLVSFELKGLGRISSGF